MNQKDRGIVKLEGRLVLPVLSRIEILRNIINIIKNSEFYLTGSRFFGTNVDESDFDFFISDDDFDKYRKTLLDLGFTKEFVGIYSSDKTLLETYKFSNIIGIQVVKSEYMFAKKVAQGRILDILCLSPFLAKKLSKSEMKLLWEEQISIVLSIS